MDIEKGRKGRILRKVWKKRKVGIRKNTRESIDKKKGQKGRILRKVWIIERSERKNTTENMDYRKGGKEEFYWKHGV